MTWVSYVGLPLMNVRGNLWTSVKGFLGATLLNLLWWRSDGEWCMIVEGRDRVGIYGLTIWWWRGWILLISSKGSCPFFVTNLWVGLCCPCLHMSWNRKGMRDTHGSEISWNFLPLFPARATRATTFLFCNATWTSPSSSSSVSLRSFNLCGTEVITGGTDTIDLWLLLVLCSLARSSFSSSSFWDCFLVFFLFYCWTMIFWIILKIPKLFKP